MSEIDQLIIDFLRLIADQTRLDILKHLKDGEKTSKEIRKLLNKSHSTITQHLKSLLDKGVITFIKKEVPTGRTEMPKEVMHYSIKDPKIFDVLTKIQSFVVSINREKLKDLRDLDIYDTLL